MRHFAIYIVLFLSFTSRLHAQTANQFESYLVGRWVVDSQKMCTDPKFTDAGVFYYLDKSGKLVSELRLPNKGQIQVARRSLFKSIEVFDAASLVIKTTAQSENLQTKATYATVSLVQFSEDFETQYLLDQSMDGVFNIRDSVVLATKQKQSPFYKCN